MKLCKDGLQRDLERWSRVMFKDLKASDFSNNTIAMYERTIADFIDYCAEYDGEISLKEIKPYMLKDFLIYKDQGKVKSRATKESYIKAIKKLFNFISDNNDEFFTYQRILSGFKTVGEKKASVEKVRYFNNEERQRYSKNINRLCDEMLSKDRFDKVQTILLSKLLYFAGLRISEALPLGFDDISEEDGFYILKIKGKGGEMQNVFILVRHIIVELEYLKLKGCSKFFIKKTGNLLDRTEAYKRLSNLYKNLGINKRGCHILRHSLAMNLVNKNINIVEIQGVLRHENIQTTMKYAHATKEGAKKAASVIAEEVEL